MAEEDVGLFSFHHLPQEWRCSASTLWLRLGRLLKRLVAAVIRNAALRVFGGVSGHRRMQRSEECVVVDVEAHVGKRIRVVITQLVSGSVT